MPPAASSQTSLPSHTGPMVAITARRSASVRATPRCKMPDAEIEAVEHDVDRQHQTRPDKTRSCSIELAPCRFARP